MAYLLEGVKVLDFTRVLAGPFAGRILADLGADVVKVEPPEGDMTRGMGRRINGISGLLHAAERRASASICVDLTKPGASELMLRMAAEADVVLENFRPGIMSGFGLGWDELSAVNPRLVMLSISGFGQSGPERDRASYAPIIHGEVGLLERQQFVDGGDQPRDFALSIADTYTRLHGARRPTGRAELRAAHRHRPARRHGDDQRHVLHRRLRQLRARGSPHRGRRRPGLRGDRAARIMLAGDEKWYWRVLNTRAGLQDPTPEGADLDTKIAPATQGHPGLPALVRRPRDALDKLNEVNLAWGDVHDHRKCSSGRDRSRAAPSSPTSTTAAAAGGGSPTRRTGSRTPKPGCAGPPPTGASTTTTPSLTGSAPATPRSTDGTAPASCSRTTRRRACGGPTPPPPDLRALISELVAPRCRCCHRGATRRGRRRPPPPPSPRLGTFSSVSAVNW